MRLPPRACLFALALLVTLLDACKPLTIDDAVYYEYARQIARRPLDPYGFLVSDDQPANHVLAPPVLLYWLGGTLRLVGERPFLWKLGLLPFSLLFALSLATLAARFLGDRRARLTLPLVALTVLSPAFLPSLNLMLDIPALALSLFSLNLFLTACDRGSLALTLAAGLMAGAAMQTKYTAFVVPALLLVAALGWRRPGLGVLAVAVAGLLFVGWEEFTAVHYGASHFSLALQMRGEPLRTRLRLVQPLVGILGSAAPGCLLLGLLALGARGRTLGIAAALVALGYLLVAVVPSAHSVLIPSRVPGRGGLTVTSAVFGSCGMTLCGLTGALLWRLLRGPGRSLPLTPTSVPVPNPEASPPRSPGVGRVEALLLAWLVLELGAYFALSPYPAVRRVLGLVVVGTLMAGRVAARAQAPSSCEQVRLAWGAAAVSAAAGLLGFAVDFERYHAERRAPEKALRRVRRLEPRATVWQCGRLGALEFYAIRSGIRRLHTAGGAVRPGDWAIAPTLRGGCPETHPLGPGWVRHGLVRTSAVLPFRSTYQVGGTALDHHEGPLVELLLYRYEPPAPVGVGPAGPAGYHVRRGS